VKLILENKRTGIIINCLFFLYTLFLSYLYPLCLRFFKFLSFFFFDQVPGAQVADDAGFQDRRLQARGADQDVVRADPRRNLIGGIDAVLERQQAGVGGQELAGRRGGGGVVWATKGTPIISHNKMSKMDSKRKAKI